MSPDCPLQEWREASSGSLLPFASEAASAAIVELCRALVGQLSLSTYRTSRGLELACVPMTKRVALP